MNSKCKFVGMAVVAILVAMSATVLIFSETNEAETVFYVDGTGYKVIAEGEVAVVHTSLNGEVTIPETVYYRGTEYGITEIADNAFQYRSGITNFSLPDSLTSIGDGAFLKCEDLTEITVPDNVTYIGTRAFEGCKKLMVLQLSEELTEIGDRAFFDCNRLLSVKIPDKVISIGESAFEKCWYLYDVVLSKSLTKISDRTFFDCRVLFHVNVPDTVTSIGENAFGQCIKLQGMSLSHGLTEIKDLAFSNCTALIDIDIPDTVVSIGSSVFLSCIELKKVHLPCDLTEINDKTFEGCVRLASINIPDSVTTIGSMAFYNCVSLVNMDLPNNLEEIGEEAFFKNKLSIVSFPSSIKTIGNGAFSKCTGIFAAIGSEDALNSITESSMKPLKLKFDGTENIDAVFNPPYVTLYIGSPGDTYEAKITAGGTPLEVIGSGNTWSFNRESYTSAELEIINVSEYVISADHVGGGVSGEGTYVHGATVVLRASAFEGYTFEGWFDGETEVCGDPEYMFMAEGNRTLTASFERKAYTVTINEDPDKGNTTGSGTYLYGEVVTIEAFPNDGYEFEGWFLNDKFETVGNPYIFVISDNMVFSPLFVVFGYDVSIYIENADPKGHYARVLPGDTVTFTISVNDGFFIHDATFVEGNASLIFDGDEVLVYDITSDCYIGVFTAPMEYGVLVKTASGEPRGTFNYILNGFTFMDDDNTFMLTEGDNLQVTAVPAEGYKFVEWIGCHSDGDPDVSLDICDSMVIAAAFESEDQTNSDGAGFNWWYLSPVLITLIVAVIFWRDP